jgi:hypothetical protein
VAPFALVTLAVVAAVAPATLGLAYDTGWAHDENSGNGYSYFSSSVFVDCAHTRVGYRQSADILTGAYSHDLAGNVLSYADMGVILENDSLAPGRLAQPDKVQLYAQASTTASKELLRMSNADPAPQRAYYVACDSDLKLTFWVASPSELRIRYEGTFLPKHGGPPYRGAVEAAMDGFAAQDRWSVNCSTCAVRRAATLAVSSGGPTRPGAYFGISDGELHRQPRVCWTDSLEGTYRDGPPGDPSSYAIVPFHARKRDIVDSPANGQSVPHDRPAFVIESEGAENAAFGLDQR